MEESIAARRSRFLVLERGGEVECAPRALGALLRGAGPVVRLSGEIFEKVEVVLLGGGIIDAEGGAGAFVRDCCGFVNPMSVSPAHAPTYCLGLRRLRERGGSAVALTLHLWVHELPMMSRPAH